MTTSATHGVRPELLETAELVPVGSLRTYPGNARRHADQALRDSLEEHGQYKPLTVRDDHTILAGNGTYGEIVRLGWTHVAVTRVTCTDAEAERLVLHDNRTHDLGGYDREALAESLTRIAATDVGLAGTGYTDEDLADLLAALDGLPDLDDLADEIGEPTVEDGLMKVSFICLPETALAWKQLLKDVSPDSNPSELRAPARVLELARERLDDLGY